MGLGALVIVLMLKSFDIIFFLKEEYVNVLVL